MKLNNLRMNSRYAEVPIPLSASWSPAFNSFLNEKPMKILSRYFACVILWSLLVNSLAAQSASPSETKRLRRLTVNDVGEYGGVPWQQPGTAIVPGSREDRVRDLNLAISSVNLTDDMSDDFLKGWAQTAEWGREQGKKFFPRVHFWDGEDRYQGPLRPIDDYWKRLDHFLAAMDLGDFAGIVLAEENVDYAGRPEILAELYRRVKAKYDVPVFQWWSPATATPSSGGWLPADGWIVDPYQMPRDQFRRYVRKYLITGLPLIIMPEAATSDNAVWTPAQWQANSDQLRVAVEFNVPVAFYWVYGTGCHFGGNRGAPQTEIDRINRWVWNYTNLVRSLPKGYTGKASADEAVGRPIELGPTDGKQFVYSDGFGDERCVDDAKMTGFRDFVLGGDKLSARGFGGRRVDAGLVYHFVGEFDVRSPKVSLDTTTDKSLKGGVEVALSLDGKKWTISRKEVAEGQHSITIETATNRDFAKIREFYVRVAVTGNAGNDEQPAVEIDNLHVEAALVPVKDATVWLKPTDKSGSTLAYEDQFQSQRYLLTTLRENEQQLEWSNGIVGVRMRPGGSQAALIWKCNSEMPLRNIRVDVTGKANSHNLGSNNYLDVSLDGNNWSHEVSTVGKQGDVNGWVHHGLTIELNDDPQFANVRQLFVRLRLIAESFQEVHPNLSGVIDSIRIEAEAASK
jgi:hypothetical protein